MEYFNSDIISAMLLNPGTYEIEIDDDFLISNPMLNAPIISSTVSVNASKHASMTIIDCTPADNAEIHMHSIGTYTGNCTVGWYNSSVVSAYSDGSLPSKVFNDAEKNKDILSSRIMISNSLSSLGLNTKDDNNQSIYVRQVKVSKKVRKLEDYCFCNCNYLTSFSISNNKNEGASLEIGKFAFANCKNLLGKAVIPIQTTKIGAGAFANCEKLYSVVMFSNCKTVEKGAFYGTKLKYIILQDRQQYDNIDEWFQKPDGLLDKVEYENNIARDDPSKYPLSDTEIEAFNKTLSKNINVTQSVIEGYYDKDGNWVDLTNLMLDAYLTELSKVQTAVFQSRMPLKALQPCPNDSFNPYNPDVENCNDDLCRRDSTRVGKCTDYICTDFICRKAFACRKYTCYAHLCDMHGCTQSDTMECMPADLCTKDASKDDKRCRLRHICGQYDPPCNDDQPCTTFTWGCDDDQSTPSQPPCSSDNTSEKNDPPQPPETDGPTFEDFKNMSDEELLKSEGIEF